MSSPGAGGGAQAYNNQSYCVTFTGTTDIGNYAFTGTLTFTTPATAAAVTACSYWTSGTESGSGSYSTPQTACSGTINASAGTPLLTLTDGNGNSFMITFIGGTEILGSYGFSDFGPAGSAAAGGDAAGSLPATYATP